MLKPSLWVFGLALLASLAVHLPVYEVLGVLAKSVLHPPQEPPSAPVELEIMALPGEPKPEVKEPEPEPPPEKPEPEKLAKKEKKVEAKRPDPPKPKPEPAKPEPPKVNLQLAQTPPPPPPPPPPKQINNAQSVTQKSDDPNVPPPENAQFVAEENRRVLEETVAEVRNLVRDDAEQQPNAAQKAPDSTQMGNAAEEDAAHFQDQKSDEDHETSRKAAASLAPTGAREPAKQDDGREHGEKAQESVAQQTARAEQQARAAEVPEQVEEIRIHDGSGTFVIRRAQPLAGKGKTLRAADEGVAGREGKKGQAATAPNLRLSFSQYEDTFGEGAIKDDRERFASQRKSKAKGDSREVVWKKFRGAIENYLPKVRPGNQTALNTAASPFAAYLASVHRQIHENFAHKFLSGLPLAGSPLSDPTLVTTLEIVINGDGSLETVGVARSSGFLPFDYGAFSSVMKAAPFPPPPSKILSGDGRVYFHWAFYRNERQCGTFNAQPYILNNGDGTQPAPAPSPLQDEGEREPSGPPPAPGEGELGVTPRRTGVPYALR